MSVLRCVLLGLGLLVCLPTNVIAGSPNLRALLAEVDDDFEPAPAFIGADVPATYFGPAPSSVMKELVGPLQLLKSGTIDFDQGTITLPLYRGTSMYRGRAVPHWFVVTDTSDAANAAALGINPSSKLKYAAVNGAYSTGTLSRGLALQRSNGFVDFAPARRVVPGAAPNFFPPTQFQAGSRGVDGYSPLVVLGAEVYNAPIVAGDVSASTLNAYCRGVFANDTEAYKILHDKVRAVCAPSNGRGAATVTLQLTQGFSFSKPVLYLSLDANNALPAALEAATVAPALSNVLVGGDDSLFSGVERIFVVTNGYTNGDKGNGTEANHPLRQGLNSALRDGKGPLNVLGGIPTVATDYSPLWDMNIGTWTPYAVANHYRTRWLEEFQILGFAQQGWVTGPNGAAFGSSGNIVNCPIVHRFL